MRTGSLMLEEYFHRLPKSPLRWPPSWDIPLAATILHPVLLLQEASCSKEVDEAISESTQNWDLAADVGQGRSVSSPSMETCGIVFYGSRSA